VKGAPEVLLPRCVAVAESDARTALDRSARQRADKVVESLAGQGLRVLAVAGRRLEEAPNGLDPDDAEELADDLVLLGFVALADIPRPAAAETVTTLAAAGIDTVMITGDHPVTALAIARQLGIAADRVVTGPELADMDDEERTAAVGRAHVFARVSPEQKLRIVRALQRAGRVVAMTGDGANDAAAIRLADVGIGMTGRGSAAARSASDLVLIRPELPLLVDALVEGRAMWRRVRDAVSVLLGGNAGEVAFTLAGTGLSGQAPIGTRQFLLVNMLTDLLPAMAIALAATPDEDDARSRLLMEGRPSLGSALTRDIAVRGGATAAGALLAWHIGRVTGTRGRASTMALAALVGTQLGQTLLVGARNPIVVATGVGSAAVLVAIVQTPGVSQFFGCRPMGPLAWATVAGSAAGATAAAAVAGRIVARNPPSAAGEDGH
jgi:cation-transporting ATPase I